MSPKTVFVIGAGASKEANLPTGNELKEQISRLLDIRFHHNKQISGDYAIKGALADYVKKPDGRQGNINPYLEQAWHIRDALPIAISIDHFIDAQRDNDKLALCGKLSIVRSILQAEKSSLLHFKNERVDSTIQFNNLEGTWFLPFFQILTENCTVNDLEDRFRSIALIIFNYDRCIEHFIYHALQNYYRVSKDYASKLLSNIEIYHPYGIVGLLPWQGNSNSTDFGEDSNPIQLLELANKIKTFTEGTNPESSKIVAIRDHVSTANRIVFLGFAFHKLNMQLIKPSDLSSTNAAEIKCYATTFGISKSDKEVINEQINDLYEYEIKTNMSDHA
ncbi:MAG: hypothetical protein LWW97_05675 [Deltaproteobacteria bacterium]|nr:hypothetical protein [Deltaproteobacteria bacterium]